MVKISINVNNKDYYLDIDAGASLLDILRNILGLTGVKHGCSVGECGACTVLIDGVAFNSCLYLAIWADKKSITTVEGLQNPDLTKVQQAFIDEGAVQCGFCTPGLVLTATSLANRRQKYSDYELKRELSGHLCRCTGYQHILQAVKKSLID